MTAFGKGMVLAVVGLSLLFCGYAVTVYANHIYHDQELKERDKTLQQLAGDRQLATYVWNQARTEQGRAEKYLAANEWWFTQELAKARSGANYDIKDLKREANGDYTTDEMGLPVRGNVISDKTYDGYLQELNRLGKEIEATRNKISDKIDAEALLTKKLNGEFDPATRKQVEPGLYDLISHEADVQRRAREEVDELKPKYFQELVDSQLLLNRRASLSARVRQLEGLDGGK
jgi:hypothetical protein